MIERERVIGLLLEKGRIHISGVCSPVPPRGHMTQSTRRVLGVVIVAVTASEGAVAHADNGPKAPRYIVDAQVCPAPDSGRYSPEGMGPYEEAVRAMLLPKSVPGILLQVVIAESFKPPLLVAVEAVDFKSKSPKQHQVRVVKGKVDVWAEMMSEMQRQQGATIYLGDEQQRRALANVSRAVETKTVPVNEVTIDPLVRAVNGVLDRTQYVREVLVAADGSHLYRAVFDGTTFHVWAGGRSAFMNSPEEGSLLGDFTTIARDLANLPDTEAKGRAAGEKAIRERVSSLLARIAMQEPCVKPYDREKDDHSSAKRGGDARGRISTP